MKLLLGAAVNGDDKPYLTRPAPDFRDPSDADPSKGPLRIPRTKITHNKLGWEKLKPSNGLHVLGSEVFRLQGLYKSNKAYAIAHQNLIWHFTKSEDLAWVIRRAINEYEK
jgi:hypothetical protein